MNGLIYGFCGFVLALVIYLAGFFSGSKFEKLAQKKNDTVLKETEIEELTEAERKLREQIEADNKAFHALTGYTADVAYGVTEFPLTEDE